MKKSVSKKMKEVIEKHMGEMNHVSSIMELTHTGARMMLQIAIEEELKAFIGRDYYERRTDNQKGLRSGFKPRTIKTGCGDIEIEMPQVRNTDIPFHSQLLPPYLTRIKEIEETIPLLYMHGLSTRKVKKAVGKLLGTRGLSHQNVIKISKKIVVEFNAWKKRDLSQTPVLYLILDGIRLGVRKNTTEKEAILIAWGFLEDGSRELIGVSLGNKESYSSWKYFLNDLIQRGLNEPLLTVIDGCPGLIKAVDEVFPTSDIQRCTKHKTENILDKVLKSDKDNVKDSIRKIFYASTYEHALEAINLFKKDWGKKYPSALECLLDDIESCLTYYKYPYTHRKRIRTTNVAERSFCEVKRRTRTIGRFQEETRALTMVWWQLKELNWYGIAMTHEVKAILDNIRASKYAKVA
jgi:transposase-like protein